MLVVVSDSTYHGAAPEIVWYVQDLEGNRFGAFQNRSDAELFLQAKLLSLLTGAKHE